jgi:Protein of unknown function (DUF3617)
MRKLLLIAAMGLLPSVVFAQNARFQPLNVKTGLWQVTATTTLSGVPPALQARLNQLTPEQRAQIEARFGGAPHTRTYRTCVTRENLEKDPFSGRDEKCNWILLNSTSRAMEFRGTSCEAGKSQGMETNVHLKIRAFDSGTVKASVNGTATGNGQTMSVSGTYTGKWLGSTCPADAE